MFKNIERIALINSNGNGLRNFFCQCIDYLSLYVKGINDRPCAKGDAEVINGITFREILDSFPKSDAVGGTVAQTLFEFNADAVLLGKKSDILAGIGSNNNFFLWRF